MTATCPVCSGADVSLDATHVDRRKRLAGAWDFWRCDRCEVLFQHPMPTPEALREYYRHYSERVEVTVAPTTAGTRWPRLRRLYHALTGDADPRDFIRPRAAARILDFGCGQAPYLADFRARGFDVAGAEIDPALVTAWRAGGFDVRLIDDLERVPFEDASFDVAYLMQVIEHIRRPERLLRDLARVLRPGGELYLALPNGRSVWRWRLGASWVSGWYAPFHLFVHSTASMERLAGAAGFELVEAWSSTPDAWFRLNLDAALRSDARDVELRPSLLLSSRWTRGPLLVLKLLAELGHREGDCLVVRLRRSSGATGAP